MKLSAVVIGLALVFAQAPATVETKAVARTVLRVIDGDTIVLVGLCCAADPKPCQPEKVRLIGMDTPERGQPGFKEATAALVKLLGKGKVRLEYDDLAGLEDRWGRTLAYVFNSEGKLTNLELLRSGHAVLYPGKFSRRAQFEKIQEEE